MKNDTTKPIRSVSINILMIAVSFVVIVFYILIASLTIRIDEESDKMQNDSAELNVFYETTNMMQSGMNTLTESARSYVVTGEKPFLTAFFNEADVNLSIRNAMERLQESDIGDELMERFEAFSANLDHMKKMEYHAMRLVADAQGQTEGLKQNKLYQPVSDYVLPENEANCSADEKKALAKELLFSNEYRTSKQTFYANLNGILNEYCDATQAEYDEASAAMDSCLLIQRTLLIALLLILLIILVLMYILLFMPLLRASKKVQNGEAMAMPRLLTEIQNLAISYNNLLEHKAALEEDLRTSAQTDALTNLPNRLALKYYMLALERRRTDTSVAVFSFDVNGLKEMNDTSGHLKGDELLRNAAECITKCFADDTNQNCFRFGGDEFAAFLTDITENEAKLRLERFESMQQKQGISVSVGFAYTENIFGITSTELFQKADEKMYHNKAIKKQNLL